MAGQVAYHLMAQAGMARAPWPTTTIVSCLPVLVLGMGTALAHMLRADANATEAPDSRTGPPATLRSLSWSFEDQDKDQTADNGGSTGTGHRGMTRTLLRQDHNTANGHLPAFYPEPRTPAAASQPSTESNHELVR
jgi:hypothetical protein